MLRERLDTALKEGLKAKDKCTVSTVRLILAAVKERDIAARGKSGDETHVDDDEIQALLQTMVKQRRESIEMYDKGGRKDLADREAREIEVIERFLPTQMDEDAIKDVVAKVAHVTAKRCHRRFRNCRDSTCVQTHAHPRRRGSSRAP